MAVDRPELRAAQGEPEIREVAEGARDTDFLIFTEVVLGTNSSDEVIPPVALAPGNREGTSGSRSIEWARYNQIDGANGVKCQYGYVIRFRLTVCKWDLQTKLSLPFLSAQAELGNLQASWLMQVRGLVGPKIDAVVLPPQELKVETFLIARQSLEAVIAAIVDPSTQFRPGIMLARIDPFSSEVGYWRSAVKAFAIENIRRGRTRSDAQARLGSPDQAQ